MLGLIGAAAFSATLPKIAEGFAINRIMKSRKISHHRLFKPDIFIDNNNYPAAADISNSCD
ncbi:hypothetical protein [Musicola paradisiaca]|uniref:hypothetical protein n=1 Tax=Musicola paradisiaca TaxID=69223 RepID=UPI000302DF22|nr:hypothetical protein [Musicola paradisiaca]